MSCLRLFLSKIDYQLQQANQGIKNNHEMYKLFLMHRENELLIWYVNWFHGRTLIVSYVVDSSCVLIIFLYTVLGLYKEMPLVIIVNCLLLVFMPFAALKDFDDCRCGIFKTSKALIENKRTIMCLKIQRAQRRQIRSWRVLRMYMGSTNYYDETTPLNLGDFCVQQTVTLLIL